MSISSKIVPDTLAKRNFHPRDEFITFDEGPHIYTIHGAQGYTSVTTWNHGHFSHFDADKIIDGMMKGKNWNDPSYKYYGMTREQIKALWDQNRIMASGSGTQMHYDIECYYNEMEIKNDSIEFQYFMNFVKDHPELKAYRTEWMIYHEELKLSGSIDMVFENAEGNLEIYDWKRVKEISYESGFGKFALTPAIGHLPDTNFWHYSLQLNTYKKILEAKYDKKITKMCLVCLHPENPLHNYEKIEVPVLEDDMNKLFQLRFEEVNNIN
jgi:hypothetical protein